MRLIDTHCHLDFKAYDGLREDMLREAAEVGVVYVIDPATDLDSSRAAVELAAAFPGVWAAVGIHPNDTAAYQPEMIDEIKRLALHDRVVAVGEIGLDYYRTYSPPTTQRAAFEAQLALAAELGKPAIIHNREADQDTLEMLAAWTAALPDTLKDRPGVLHSFSSSWEVAERALELGFYLGFTGPVTFKKADDLRAIAARVPVDRILVETDGPFLTPQPHRGQFPNHPAYVRYVAEQIAAARGLPADDFAAQTTANAIRLFGLR
ncbi:MAG: TatD family hydrolase [Chloroflexi bacterium]|nr:TatD family hydrolase [Chloroflexota bacterium]